MGKNKDLQKMLTEFEKEFGHIKEWEIDRNERLRGQASDAASMIPNEARSRGGKTNAKSGHLKRIAHLGGNANVKSGHIQNISKLGAEAAAKLSIKAVVKLDKRGNLLGVYNSLREAQEKNNVKSISNNIAGRTKYCKGYKYMFKEDYDKLDKEEIKNICQMSDNRVKQTKCPYCNKMITNPTNYNRWHGDNCKKNPNKSLDNSK